MKHLLLVAVLMLLVSCATEEENSTVSNLSQASSDAVPCEDIPIERADVNQDGIVNILDLTAASCHFGQKLTGLKYAYYALLYLQGGAGQLSGTVATSESFNVSVNAAVDWSSDGNAAQDTLKKTAHEKSTNALRVEAHSADGELVERTLALWPRGSGNIYAVGKRSSYSVAFGLFFTDGAENNNISKLVFYMGDTRVDDAEIEVTALADSTITLTAEPASYITSDGAKVERTYYILSSAIDDPEGESFKFADEVREKGVEFITIDDDGTVLQYFNTKAPGGFWSSGASGGTNPYFRADVYQFTCSAGQTVFARIADDINIYQGTCE